MRPPVARETIQFETLGTGGLHCITRDPEEPVTAQELGVCDDNPVAIVASIHCEGTGCGGHLICRPCLDAAYESGLVR
jgi:hypothetical protein